MIKKKFILDHCVIMNAAKLRDSEGNISICALSALTNIIKKCHRLVFTYEMEKTYFKKISLLKRNKEFEIDVSPLLIQASLLEGKLERMNNYLEPVADEHLIHKNDVNLLRLSCVSKGIIVTSDKKLLCALEIHGFREKYGIEFISTEDIDEHL